MSNSKVTHLTSSNKWLQRAFIRDLNKTAIVLCIFYFRQVTGQG